MAPGSARLPRFVAQLLCSASLIGTMIASMVGCASPAPPGQCRVRVVISADPKVNLDIDGQSLPTPISFWQLKDIAPMSEASFEDIWERSEATLGNSVVEVKEVTIFPGQKHKEDYLIAEETVYVAATAIFRKPEGTSWRTYVKLPPAQTIARCEEGKVGGPLYIHAVGNMIKGGHKIFSMSSSTSTKGPAKKSDGNEVGKFKNDDATKEGADDEEEGGKKKKRKKKKRKRSRRRKRRRR